MTIKKHINQKSHALNHDHLLRRKIFLILGSAFVLLMIAYAYFLSVNVLHVIVRAGFEKEARSIMSEKSVLEQTYLEKIQGISYAYASELGYNEVSNTYFAPRQAYAQVDTKSRHEL